MNGKRSFGKTLNCDLEPVELCFRLLLVELKAGSFQWKGLICGGQFASLSWGELTVHDGDISLLIRGLSPDFV